MSLGTKHVVLTPATQTAGGASSAQSTVSLPDGLLSLFVNVTAAVSPTFLRVWPEWSDDNGTTWYPGSEDVFYLIDVATQVRSYPVHSDKYRVAWSMVGTSFTFGVNSFGALI